MSLIVARQEGKNILIVSDTKLTYPLIDYRSLKYKVEDSVLKSIIINENICISFAGVIDFADNAIRAVDVSESLPIILDILLHYHKLSDQETEFILCSNIQNPIIYEIKNGEVKPTISTWIGDKAAFNVFQKNTFEEKKIMSGSNLVITQSLPTSSLNKMSSAMDDVINNNSVESVGGFKILIALHNGKFAYEFYMNMSREPMNIFLKGGVSNAVTIGHGIAENGAYTLNFLGASNDNQHVAFHIRQGNLGVVYSRRDMGLLYPEVKKDMDEVDFYDYINNKYKIFPPFRTQDRFQKFSSDAYTAYQKRDFVNATLFFDKAANESSGERKAEMFFNKGVSLHYLKNLEALSAFRQAVEIDPKYQAKIFQFINKVNWKNK